MLAKLPFAVASPSVRGSFFLHMDKSENDTPVAVIKPPTGWEAIDFKELRQYRDLFYFLVLRDVKVLYAQSILGFSWAILNPAVQIILFTVIFGKIANIPSDGIPYFLFSTVAIIPWTYMSEATAQSSQSLVSEQGMLGKVYFPRMIYPLTPLLSKLVDFSISLLLLIGVLIYYKVTPTWNMLLLPLFVFYMMLIPAGIGLWLSSLAVRFRDVKFAMSFIIRLLIYTAPVLYSASSIPPEYRLLYSLNPIVGVVEGFRASLLGGPIPWEFIVPGMVTGLVLVLTGAMYFRRMERVIVDVI
jgi:lipopolysaccharide transport system permease protein